MRREVLGLVEVKFRAMVIVLMLKTNKCDYEEMESS
jgi:hypothetical protein